MNRNTLRLPIAVLAAAILSTGLLSACKPPPPANAPDATAPVATETEPPPAATSDGVQDAPPAATDTPDTGLVQWQGYGDTRFGMDEAAFKKAWGGSEFNSYDFEEKQHCFHLWPKGQKESSDLAFMFVDGKFARYSIESPKQTAPGGGKVGMTTAEILKLYPGKVEHQPHKYTDGEYLRITNGANVLLFETNAKGDAGKVTDWRVGVPPAVDYVEGCS